MTWCGISDSHMHVCPWQVAEFWHEVELATNVRQQGMFRAVNLHLERLSLAVNAAVGDLLQLRIEPVLVRMEPPSAAEFHSSLQELFEKGELMLGDFAWAPLGLPAIHRCSYP